MGQYLKAKAKYEEALSLDQEMEKYFPQSSTVKSNISTVLGDMAINAANLKIMKQQINMLVKLMKSLKQFLRKLIQMICY